MAFVFIPPWWFWMLAGSASGQDDQSEEAPDTCPACGEPILHPCIPEPEGYDRKHCRRCCREINKRQKQREAAGGGA